MFIMDIDWIKVIWIAANILLCCAWFQILAQGHVRAVEDRIRVVEDRVRVAEDYIRVRKAERKAILENAVSHPTF